MGWTKTIKPHGVALLGADGGVSSSKLYCHLGELAEEEPGVWTWFATLSRRPQSPVCYGGYLLREVITQSLLCIGQKYISP